MWLSGDCLPSKPKALNSIPSTTKKKKNSNLQTYWHTYNLGGTDGQNYSSRPAWAKYEQDPTYINR
jgi:hypothetical protein